MLFGGRVTLSSSASRGLSILWLLAALAFAVVAVGVWRQASWSVGTLVAVAVASLALTVVWWPSARVGAIVNAAILAALVAWGYASYRREVGVERVKATTGSLMIETKSGPIEYAAHGFRVIAPSRYGYLRTPMPPHATAESEADTWADFLDALGIDRVAVVSYSAGAMPAAQFALRHSERVTRLVFFVPAASGFIAERAPGPPAWVMNIALKWDLPMWLAMRLAPKSMLSIVATPASLVPSLSSADRARLDDVIRSLLPVSIRRRGIMYDGKNEGPGPVFPHERIAAPTLLISAEDDLYRTMLAARRAAQVIPNARLLAFPTGGHLLLGRSGEIWPAVISFLR